ncbi:MAG TPA: hypothetical protein VF081_04260 [Solirubrobacterales bacterium]
MDERLAGCEAKLDRAEDLRAQLEKEVETFFKENAPWVDGDWRPKKREYALIARVPKEPPLHWGVLLGDWAHNLRSALDHLMWQLVLLRDGEPTRRTQFPIFTNRARYRLLGRPMIDGVKRKDRGTLERLQPYKAGLPKFVHPLALLAWISNLDKHRIVHPTLLHLGGEWEGIEDFRPNEDAGEIEKVIWPRGSWTFREGKELVRLRLAPSGPAPSVDQPESWGVAIDLAERSIGLRDLHRIEVGVSYVFDVLGPEFDA